MTRKIVQIAACAEDDGHGLPIRVVYALADDGTLWCRRGWGNEWELQPDLPQEVVTKIVRSP